MTIKNRKSKIENRRAFTLVEMLLVIGIIAVLLALLVPVTLKVQERDQVPKASNMITGALGRAKMLALRDRVPVGIRLLPRINQGEIPATLLVNGSPASYNPGAPPMSPAFFDILYDIDGDGVVTFKDLNYQENSPPTQAGGPSHQSKFGMFINRSPRVQTASGRSPDNYNVYVNDLNGNGVIDIADLQQPFNPIPGEEGAGGWADGKDNDGNGIVDDIVTSVIQLEYIQEPPPFRDGWVWNKPQPTGTFVNPSPPPSITYTGRAMVPNPEAPPDYVSADVVSDQEIETAGDNPDGRPFYRVFGPYSAGSQRWSSEEPGGNLGHSPQRATFEFVDAVQPGDFFQPDPTSGTTQTYLVVRVLPAKPNATPAPELAYSIPLSVRENAGGLPPRLILWRQPNGGNPINAPQPMYALSPNYQIIRRPRPIPAEKPIDLPADTIIDLSTDSPRSDGDTTLLSNYDYDDTTKPDFTGDLDSANGGFGGFYYRGLTTPGVLDIVFTPGGQVLNTHRDVIYLWVRDTHPGRPDNQALIAIQTRTGKIASYPVNQVWDTAATPTDPRHADPYYFPKNAVAEGGL